jgi:ubiquitin-like modifier-activating enzyme ATG7
MEPANGLLRFEPFVSSVDLSFWHELCRKKLDIFRLSEEPVPIHAFFNLGSSVDSAARLALTSTAFDVTAKCVRIHSPFAPLHRENSFLVYLWT